MRILVVGDVHAKATELDDCVALGKLILDTASTEQPDYVLFLGDQYDTHGIVHVEVQRFWMRLFDELMAFGKPVIALRGNHDMIGNGLDSAADAMQVHDARIEVVRGTLKLNSHLGFAGYGADLTSEYLSGCKYVFCHHTFDGAQYENGFYAKGGIDPATMEYPYIVSGHIHTPATLTTNVSKIQYVGAPRWLTAADANISRAITLIDTETDIWKAFYTNKVCSQILRYEDREEASLLISNLDVNPKDRVVVDIHGPAIYVEARAPLFKKLGIRVRTFPTTEVKRTISESEGVGVSWRKYCGLYQPRYQTPKEQLLTKAQEELNVG